MIKKLNVMLAVNLLASASAIAGSATDAVPALQRAASLPEIVEAVKAQNAKNLSLDEIKRLDQTWIDAEGKLPQADEALGNKAAKSLIRFEQDTPYLVEAILTDNQGANVAITSRTSDYWQGDEPKFARAFKNGAGDVFIARPKRDGSTGEVVSQVSVPVMSDGKAIGTLTWGVRVDRIR